MCIQLSENTYSNDYLINIELRENNKFGNHNKVPINP